MLEICPANISDYKQIIQLLEKSVLPTSDVSLKDTYFLKAIKYKKLVGVVGVQITGNEALLRSMAVEVSVQNQRIGQELLQQALAYAEKQQVREIYLITTTAQKYFEHKEFTVITRAETPESIKNTTQFSKICAASGIVMRKRLNQ